MAEEYQVLVWYTLDSSAISLDLLLLFYEKKETIYYFSVLKATIWLVCFIQSGSVLLTPTQFPVLLLIPSVPSPSHSHCSFSFWELAAAPDLRAFKFFEVPHPLSSKNFWPKWPEAHHVHVNVFAQSSTILVITHGRLNTWWLMGTLTKYGLSLSPTSFVLHIFRLVFSLCLFAFYIVLCKKSCNFFFGCVVSHQFQT